MDPWTSDMASQLMWATDLPSAQATFRTVTARCGVALYAYANSRPGMDRPYLDTTYPAAWIEHYLTRRYQYIDPLIEEARSSHLPFAWRFLINRSGRLSPEQRRLFEEAAEHGLRDGFTLPFHGHDGCFALLSFAFPSAQDMKQAMAAQSDIKMLAVYYHTAVERLLEADAPDSQLSPMERQCLAWAARGRTLWEISSLARSPEPDVAFALRCAREKLGTSTTAQAVAKAIADGLIAPI